MHPRVMAARSQVAQRRLLSATAILAERHGANEQLAALRAVRVPGNDPRVRALAEREALADLLEAIAATAPTAPKTRKADIHAASPA